MAGLPFDVHFVFTAMVESFNDVQADALRRVPIRRMLLETDSPHLAVKKRRSYIRIN